MGRESHGRLSVRSLTSNYNEKSMDEESMCHTSQNCHVEVSEFRFENNAIFKSSLVADLALTTCAEFPPQMAFMLRKLNPPDSREFYKAVLELFAQFGTKIENAFFHKPITERIYLPGEVIQKNAKVHADDLLAQLLNIADDLSFMFVLKGFFLNVFDLVLTPIRMLLLLIQEYFYKPVLGFTASERRGVHSSLKKTTKKRVLIFIEHWIIKREKDFLHGEKDLLFLFYRFVSTVRNSKVYLSSRDVNIEDIYKLVQIAMKKRKSPTMLSFDTKGIDQNLSPDQEKLLRMTGDDSTLDFFRSTTNEDIAKALFLIDVQIFYKLGIYDLHPKRLNDMKESTEAYSDFVYRLNTFPYFYVYLIICQTSHDARLKVMGKLVKLARLMKDGPAMNLEGYQHIKLAFRQPSISELARCHFKLRVKGPQNRELDLEDQQEYESLMGDLKTNFMDGFKRMKQVQVPLVPSVLPFVQFYSKNFDNTRIYVKKDTGEAHLNLEELNKYSEFSTMLEKAQHSEITKKYKIGIDDRTKTPLFVFLEKGYQTFLSRCLKVKQLDHFDTQRNLSEMSRRLHDR